MPPPNGGDEGPPRDALSAARRYSRPGHKPPDVPSNAAARADSTRAPSNGSQVSPPRTARALGITAILLWFFPCTLGCVASIVLGVLSQRKAAQEGGSTLLGKVAWIGGLVFTVAEVIVFLIYRPD